MFCPRQAYLSFIEKEDAVNSHIILGDILHKNVVHPQAMLLNNKSVEKAVYIRSGILGIHGIIDTIEQKNGMVFPVEYKKSARVNRKCEHIQVSLQALCIEEMLNISIPIIYVYHGKTRRREKVTLDYKLRQRSLAEIHKTRQTLEQDIAPPSKIIPSCKGCSLKEICMPKTCSDNTSISHWVLKHIE